MEQNLIAKLVSGSHNIDRMKREVDMVLGMLNYHMLGYAMQAYPRTEALFFEDPEHGNWHGRWLPHHEKMSMSFSLSGPPRGKDTHLAYSYYPGDDYRWRLLYGVQHVHAALPTLTSGLIGWLPGLMDSLQPILAAADYNFEKL